MTMADRTGGRQSKKCLYSFVLQGIILLLVLLMSLLLTISGGLFLKSQTTQKELNTVSAGYNRYTIRDTLLGDDEFYFFRTDKQKLNTLVQFYNSLYNSSDVNLLTTFNQPIFINGFDKGAEFFYHQHPVETRNASGLVTAVKSFQMNQKAFEFYNLRLEEGSQFDWDGVLLSKDKPNPIILGSRYRNHYRIGDKIIADFYSSGVEFQVQGFLAEDSYVYFKENPEFYLDDYMIIPYPDLLSEVTGPDFSMEGILYFAMLNSQFVTSLSQQEVIQMIQNRAHQSGFMAFTIVEIDDFAMKYSRLLSIIREQSLLLSILLLVLSTLFSYLIINLLLLLTRLYSDEITVSLIIGEDLQSKLLHRFCFRLYMISLLTCFLAEVILFKTMTITIMSSILNFGLCIAFYYILNSRRIKI